MLMTLLEKSDKNIKAADLLVVNEFYSSSIHCYYYSTFQLMSHIVFNVFNVDEDEFRKNIKGKNSHNYLINLFRNDLILGGQDIRVIGSDLSGLKQLRRDADYTQKVVTKNNSSNARHFSTKLNGSIKKMYNL